MIGETKKTDIIALYICKYFFFLFPLIVGLKNLESLFYQLHINIKMKVFNYYFLLHFFSVRGHYAKNMNSLKLRALQ